MAPSSLPHQEDPNKISLECGRDAGRQNTSGWTLPHLSKYIATASHQINWWHTQEYLTPGSFLKWWETKFWSLMETKRCVVFLASFHLQHVPGVWLPRRAPRRWGRRRSGGSGPGSGSPPGPAAPPASPCHAPCHAVSRGVTSGHCVVPLLSANHKSSLACESLPGRVHDAVTYSIMLVTSDDAVALLVSQISPGLAG